MKYPSAYQEVSKAWFSSAYEAHDYAAEFTEPGDVMHFHINDDGTFLVTIARSTTLARSLKQ